MSGGGYRKTIIAGAIAMTWTLVIGLFSAGEGPLRNLENKILDQWFKLRKTLPVDSRIVLIDIDDESIAKIGRWPWDRTYHARMIEILSSSGAGVIGYDILFNQPAGNQEDDEIVKAVQKAGNVVLPVGFELEKGRSGKGLLAVQREIRPFPEIRQAAAKVGHISSNPDPDGTIRNVPLVVQAGDQQVPAFSLAMLEGYFKVPHDRVLVRLGRAIVLQDADIPGRNVRADINIPIHAEGMMRINYAGPWVETFDHYSFADILEASETESGRHHLMRILQGKICLVSNTATGYDLKLIPLEGDYPGGGIHANAINTILSGRYLREIGTPSSLGILFLLSFAAGGLTMKGRWWVGLISSLLLVLASVGATIYSLQRGVILQTLSPVLAIAMTYVSVLINEIRLARRHVKELVRDKEQIGETLHKVTQALRTNEAQLKENREELSRLIHNLQEIQGQEREKLERIHFLESAVERANLERDDLQRKKWHLDEKMADLLVAPMQEDRSLHQDLKALQLECAHHGIVTRSREMLQVFESVERVAKTMSPVLIQGETGTGKELIARAIHHRSSRSTMPLITVNIPALQDNLIESELFGHLKGSFTSAVSDKKGKFQSADGGTIFLDEIGDMKPELQAKLLRVLQNGEVDRVGASAPVRVDVRIIAATNRDLEAEVRHGNFREDLFYRLNVMRMTLPPLRERREDIEPLAHYFLGKNNLELDRTIKGLTVKAMGRLLEHPWMGNVRELENAIARGFALARGPRLTEADLQLTGKQRTVVLPETFKDHDPKAMREGNPLSDRAFLALLRENQFEIGTTAEQLSISRETARSRFKGICLKILVEKGGDFSETAEMISGGWRASELVEPRVREYYGNFLKVIQNFETCEDAVREYRRRFKNMPQRYLDSLDALAKRYFDQIGTKP